MTLLDFISNLTTENVSVSVVDNATEQEIIEFKSQGYAGIESDISARTVKKWSIKTYTNTPAHITVILDATNN